MKDPSGRVSIPMLTQLIPGGIKPATIFVMEFDPESQWFYKRMEAPSDGVIDIRVMQHEGIAKNFLRVRSLRGQPHDAAWHEIEIKSNGEATLKM